jgi:hypothetical protein
LSEDKIFDLFEHDSMNTIEKLDIGFLNVPNRDYISRRKFNFKIQSLKSLNIISSKMSYTNTIKFLDSLYEGNDKLEELHIDFNFSNEQDDTKKRGFLKRLSLFKELNYLDINFSKHIFQYDSKKNYNEIIHFKKIKFLNVSDCFIDLEEFLYILNCFENLSHLNIQRNNAFSNFPMILDELMSKLVDILSNHEHIENLNLDSNDFLSPNQEKIFIKIFEKNKNIKRVKMEVKKPSILFDIDDLRLEEIKVNNTDEGEIDYSGIHHNKTLKKLIMNSISIN